MDKMTEDYNILLEKLETGQIEKENEAAEDMPLELTEATPQKKT